MAKKQNFVRDIRLATDKDIEKLSTFDVNVPIYDKSMVDTLKDKSNDEVKRIMSKSRPMNIVTATKEVVDGFVDLFQAITKESEQYTEVLNLTVTGIALVGPNKTIFKGEIIGKNGYVVAVKVADKVVLCPIQAECWLFA